MRFHERSFKLRRMNKNEDSTRAKFNQIEEDEEKKKSKIHFIKKVCLVKSRKMKVH